MEGNYLFIKCDILMFAIFIVIVNSISRLRYL